MFAVDHFEEICDLAMCNVMKSHEEYFAEDRIEFITKDGSKGLAEEGPYDVIHVGAAPVKMIPELIE